MRILNDSKYSSCFFGREMCLHSTHSCLYFVLSWLEANINNCQSQVVGEQVFLFCYVLCLSIWNLMSWIGKSKWSLPPPSPPWSNPVPRKTVESITHTLAAELPSSLRVLGRRLYHIRLEVVIIAVAVTTLPALKHLLFVFPIHLRVHRNGWISELVCGCRDEDQESSDNLIGFPPMSPFP